MRHQTWIGALLLLTLAACVGSGPVEITPTIAVAETPTAVASHPTALPEPAAALTGTLFVEPTPRAAPLSTPVPAPPSPTPLPTFAVPYLPNRAQAAATSAARPPLPPPLPAEPTPDDPGDATPTPEAPRLVGPASVPRSPRYEPLPLHPDAVLERRVRDLLGEEVGSYAIVVKRITDGRGFTLHPDDVHYAASLFKLEVMYEVFKQRELGLLSFSEWLTMTSRYADYDLNTLAWPVGSAVPIADLMEAMIVRSDNASAILLQDKVGAWNLNADLKTLGMKHTILSADLTTSAADMALLLEAIARGQAVNQKASQDMVNLLLRQTINDRLPLKLPREVLVAHKTGNWDDATHDVGIVYAPSGPYVIVLLSRQPGDSRTLAEVSRLVYDHFETPASAD